MTPYEVERLRLQLIAKQVKREDIWGQVYSAVFAQAIFKEADYDAVHRATKAADQAVQRFEDHIRK